MKKINFLLYDIYSTLMKRNSFLLYFRRFISLKIFILLQLLITIAPIPVSIKISQLLKNGNIKFRYSDIIILHIDNYRYILIMFCMVIAIFLIRQDIRRSVYIMQNENMVLSLTGLNLLKKNQLEKLIMLKFSLIIVMENIFYVYPVLVLINSISFEFYDLFIMYTYLFILSLVIILLSFVCIYRQYYNMIYKNESIFLELLILSLKNLFGFLFGFFIASKVSRWLLSFPIFNNQVNMISINQWLESIANFFKKINFFISNNLMSISTMFILIYIVYFCLLKCNIFLNKKINKHIKKINLPDDYNHSLFTLYIFKIIRSNNFILRFRYLLGSPFLWGNFGICLHLCLFESKEKNMVMSIITISSLYIFFSFMLFLIKYFPDIYEVSSESKNLYLWKNNGNIIKLLFIKQKLFIIHISSVCLLYFTPLIFVDINLSISFLYIVSVVSSLYLITLTQKLFLLKVDADNPFEISQLNDEKLSTESINIIFISIVLPLACIPTSYLITEKISIVTHNNILLGIILLLWIFMTVLFFYLKIIIRK